MVLYFRCITDVTLLWQSRKLGPRLRLHLHPLAYPFHSLPLFAVHCEVII